MKYFEFRDLVHKALVNHPSGLTWIELRDSLNLPYHRPCPEWTKQLESEIKLTRTEKRGNSLIWRIPDV